MAKSKERLDAEKDHPMNGKEKISNFWFYYKWWVLGGGFALLMGILLIRDVVSNVKPDYTIGLLTPYTVPDETMKALEGSIQPYLDDRNGDGKVVVYLSPYNIGLDENQTGDPMAHAANMTRLSGDIQMGESMLFITDNLEGYQEKLQLFCYNDGSDPPLEGKPDYSRMGVPLSDCLAFETLDLSAASPDEFTLVKRTISQSQLERTKGQVEYHGDCMELFDLLTGF